MYAPKGPVLTLWESVWPFLVLIGVMGLVFYIGCRFSG